jgi:hypothetical protein
MFILAAVRKPADLNGALKRVSLVGDWSLCAAIGLLFAFVEVAGFHALFREVVGGAVLAGFGIAVAVACLIGWWHSQRAWKEPDPAQHAGGTAS